MENQTTDPKLVHNLNDSTAQKFFTLPIFFGLVVLTIVLGVGFGFLTNKIIGSGQGSTTTKASSQKSAGIADKKTFKDKAEGLLKEGGIDGEGNFHLVRPGGESQNVYLTSTIVDLSQFVGKKVRVWGETFSGEKAGWLMDVGLVETL